MAYKVLFASEASIKIDLASSVTVTTSAALETFFSAATAVQGVAKDISIKQPVGDAEKLDFLGTDASGYQNAELELKPAGLAEISMTVIIPGDEGAEAEIFGAGTAINATHTRYNPGKAVRAPIAILLNITDGTDVVNFAADNCILTSYEPKVTGADGHFEAAITMKCLPRDFYGPEFKD